MVRRCITGRIGGKRPDDDGVTTRCAAYRDGAQDAGLVADDQQITTGTVTFERVKRGEECVVLTFRESP